MSYSSDYVYGYMRMTVNDNHVGHDVYKKAGIDIIYCWYTLISRSMYDLY